MSWGKRTDAVCLRKRQGTQAVSHAPHAFQDIKSSHVRGFAAAAAAAAAASLWHAPVPDAREEKTRDRGEVAAGALYIYKLQKRGKEEKEG